MIRDRLDVTVVTFFATQDRARSGRSGASLLLAGIDGEDWRM
jgi:hypothetical protein